MNVEQQFHCNCLYRLKVLVCMILPFTIKLLPYFICKHRPVWLQGNKEVKWFTHFKFFLADEVHMQCHMSVIYVMELNQYAAQLK